MPAHRYSSLRFLIARTYKVENSCNVRGFTLVELLVCLIIISLLAGMLLPAVMSVRSNARRTQCTNNVFQIGVALNNYHDAHRTFPPGYVAQVGTQGQDLAAGSTWAVLLLPMLDERLTNERMRIAAAAGDSRQLGLSPRLDIFVCPSDAAASSYVASFGQGDMWLQPDSGDGVFFRNSRIRLRDIEDGLMTILVGERSSDQGAAAWAGVYAINDPTKPVGTDGVVDRSLVLGHTGAVAGNHPVHPPNAMASCGAGYGSMHSDGANFLMADGSVRFVGSQIDPGVFAGLATRAGGEPVNLTDF